MKLDADALKKLPLNQKLKQIAIPSKQYGRSVLIGVAIEVIPEYLKVEKNLSSRINNRDVRIISASDAADTVKAINEVLKSPLVEDGKAISNAIIGAGKLISKNFSKINLWGSPEFVRILNDKKAQIYQRFPNLDLNAPVPKRGSSIPSNQQVQLGVDPNQAAIDEAAAATARGDQNTQRVNQGIVSSPNIRRTDTTDTHLWNRPFVPLPPPTSGFGSPGSALDNTRGPTNRQIIAQYNNDVRQYENQRKQEQAIANRAADAAQRDNDRRTAEDPNNFINRSRPLTEAENQRFIKEQSNMVDVFGRRRDEAALGSSTDRNVRRHSVFPIIVQVEKTPNLIQKTISPYEQSIKNDIANFTRYPVDTKKPEKNTVKGSATVQLGEDIKKLTQNDIKKIRSMASNTYELIGGILVVVKVDKKTVIIARQIPNSNNLYVSEKRTIP
jgi:hypothetical protein